jgi:hypothetical protein
MSKASEASEATDNILYRVPRKFQGWGPIKNLFLIIAVQVKLLTPICHWPKTYRCSQYWDWDMICWKKVSIFFLWMFFWFFPNPACDLIFMGGPVGVWISPGPLALRFLNLTPPPHTPHPRSCRYIYVIYQKPFKKAIKLRRFSFFLATLICGNWWHTTRREHIYIY